MGKEVRKISFELIYRGSSLWYPHSLIHGGRVANALASNAKGDGFASHLHWYFRELFLESIQSPAHSYLNWCMR
jgi:hypothetical protein